jgi:hypothetical protein
MIGPFATAPGGFTHVLVAIDKFTKWIGFKPITKLTPDRVVDFISDILHRFGFPNTIITDLGSNFTANQFWEFCENSSIEVKYISVAHPRANGQVERANGLIIDGLKKRLYDANTKKGGKWIHELPHVVWGLTIQPSKATGQTPFFLVYGSEAILPATSCGNPQGSRCVHKARWTKHDSWSWILSKRLAALLSLSQPVTCRGSGDIMIATLRNGRLA